MRGQLPPTLGKRLYNMSPDLDMVNLKDHTTQINLINLISTGFHLEGQVSTLDIEINLTTSTGGELHYISYTSEGDYPRLNGYPGPQPPKYRQCNMREKS